MNLRSMLARLEDAFGCADLTKQMVLVPPRATHPRLSKEINLIVGYNGSPCSQSALDLTLWIAHQTRLATGKQVTVQVVYVLDLAAACHPTAPHRELAERSLMAWPRPDSQVDRAQSLAGTRSISAVAERPQSSDRATAALSCQLNQFDQADLILWQARNLADEWRGSLKTHLRFGNVADELRSVVESESAALLLLGCHSADHPLVQQLGDAFPCAVLGIPSADPASHSDH